MYVIYILRTYKGFFCGILVFFFLVHVYMHVCHLCVVTQEANFGSEINPQQLQMKTTHTNSQLIKPRVFVYSYNNSSLRHGGGPCFVRCAPRPLITY